MRGEIEIREDKMRKEKGIRGRKRERGRRRLGVGGGRRGRVKRRRGEGGVSGRKSTYIEKERKTVGESQ